jgi:hypothetical protein
MKKILVLMMVASSIATFALNPSDYNAFYKLNNKAAFTGLVGYIDADQEQATYLQHIIKITADELKVATKKGNDMAVGNVLKYNFRNTKCILSETQYKKYLKYINVYLNNENNFCLVTENNNK